MAVKIIDNSGSANFTPYIEYIKGEKGDKGDKGDAGVVEFIVVNELPAEDIKNAIYLVPAEDAQEQNIFNEYVYINEAWECIGSTGVSVDLSQYVKNTDYATYAKGGVVRLGGAFTLNDGLLIAAPTSLNDIQTRNTSKMLKCSEVDRAVKIGMTTNNEAWTEEDKSAACELIGALEQKEFTNSKSFEGTKAGCAASAYVINHNGEQAVMPIYTQNQNWTIPCRDGAGNFYIGEPSLQWHAATKAYVDKAVGSYELVEEITVTEAGNVERNATPSGAAYSSLYKNMLVTIKNATGKGCTFCYIYRGNDKLCLLQSSVNIGEFGVIKTEVVAEGLSIWEASKVGTEQYALNNNTGIGYLENSDNIKRLLVGGCEAGTVIKIYGAKV